MYKIIGADQIEYGPVDAHELRQWIAQGRADAQTMVQLEGGTEWEPLSNFPEFAADFAPESPPSSPPPFTPPTYAPQSAPTNATNPMATAGLVCGILSFACCSCGPLFPLLGLICSCIALSQINTHPEQRGREIAIVGLVLSVLGGLVTLGYWTTNLSSHGFNRFFR